MKKRPLVSFCLATYKRPEFLRSTLNSILAQTYTNFEIIVSDNDPKGSAKTVVNSLRNCKISYYRNMGRPDMMSNFNNALHYAHGDFTVFICDDDPIRPVMLKTLISLYKKFPTNLAFYGASELYLNDSTIQKLHFSSSDSVPLHNKFHKPNAILTITSDQFKKSFFNYSILPYFLWSTGMVKTDFVKSIGGMPDYGSPFLTDFAYIYKVGSSNGIIVINTILGGQTIHQNNHGRTFKDLELLKIGVKEFDKLVSSTLFNHNEIKTYSNFLRNWTIAHLCNTLKVELSKYEQGYKHRLIDYYKSICQVLPFFNSGLIELYLRLYLPIPFDFIFLVLHFLKRNFILFFETRKFA